MRWAELVLFAPVEMKDLTRFRGRRRVPLSAAVSGTANQDTASCPSPANLKLSHHHGCPQLHTTGVQSSFIYYTSTLFLKLWTNIIIEIKVGRPHFSFRLLLDLWTLDDKQ